MLANRPLCAWLRVTSSQFVSIGTRERIVSDERDGMLASRFSNRDERASGADHPPKQIQRRRQKNLSLCDQDADRLVKLAKRDRLSQAGLLGRALDAYEELHGKLRE